ncbi:MAG TPA: extracellular solute-binding protein [Candidatus Binatia bacterium]|nr:extracellular solute-binding protein [Candidatus Binatia bacterium]
MLYRRPDGSKRLWIRLGSIIAASGLVLLTLGASALAQLSSQAEWERILAAARKEGKVVVGIPPSAELRAQIGELFKRKFGIDMEPVAARGAQNASRIISESRGGVKFFDAVITGSGSALTVLHAGFLDPLEPYMLLPEVKEPKHWWGGHIWEDNVTNKRSLYSFIADADTGGLWHNTDVVKSAEVHSFDDLLNPKWKRKIGLNDPRIGGSGQSLWSFLWDIKGEDYLRKLVQQELFLSRNMRQIADALARGTLALSIGVGISEFEPHLKAGLPVKELPKPKEGLPASSAFGVVGIVKDPPHPNAAKIFFNWLLSKEGQEFYGRAMESSTRRLDVDTRWLVSRGMRPAKDFLTVEEYHRVRNQLEDKVVNVRWPAAKFAEAILK